MANLCCCECPLNFGCLPMCKELDTLQEVPIGGAGKYKLIYKFNGAVMELSTAELEEGDEITFDISEIVPDYVYTAVIEDPNGENMTLVKDVIEYDCLTFKPLLVVKF